MASRTATAMAAEPAPLTLEQLDALAVLVRRCRFRLDRPRRKYNPRLYKRLCTVAARQAYTDRTNIDAALALGMISRLDVAAALAWGGR